MTPSGELCDAPRDDAASDANACPYTPRLKARINSLYQLAWSQLAWSGHGNPNPILSPGANCGPRLSTPATVSYFPATMSTRRTVALVRTCPNSAADASASWQRLVFVSGPGSTPVVDDILRDVGHSGRFTSIYG